MDCAIDGGIDGIDDATGIAVGALALRAWKKGIVVGRGGWDGSGTAHDDADGGWDGWGGPHDDAPGDGMAKA
jgi:hypothetical protein